MKRSKVVKTKPRTHKGASKRFKVTPTGKLLHRSQGARHNINNKSKKQIRRLRRIKQLQGLAKKKIMKLLRLA